MAIGLALPKANYAMLQSSAMIWWKIATGKPGHTSATAYPLIGVLEVTSSFRRVFYQLQSQTVSRKRNPFFKKIV